MSLVRFCLLFLGKEIPGGWAWKINLLPYFLPVATQGERFRLVKEKGDLAEIKIVAA